MTFIWKNINESKFFFSFIKKKKKEICDTYTLHNYIILYVYIYLHSWWDNAPSQSLSYLCQMHGHNYMYILYSITLICHLLVTSLARQCTITIFIPFVPHAWPNWAKISLILIHLIVFILWTCDKHVYFLYNKWRPSYQFF